MSGSHAAMPGNATQQEPSMDEILASIKKIISEDERQSQKGRQPTAAADRAPSSGGADARRSGDGGQNGREGRRAMPMGPRANPFLPRRAAQTEERSERPPSPAWRTGAVAPRQEPAAPMPQRLASELTERTATAAFGKLSQTLMAGSQSRTLEDVIGEMIRPLLKVWLDENLPSLVEKLVREEIEKVARGGR